MSEKVTRRDRVLEKARALGFEVVGVARADLPLGTEFDRYRTFLERGMQGEMAYLAEDPEARQRLDGEAILPGARSVVCVAKSYRRSDEANDPAVAKLIARYARGQDYHNHLRKKLRQLARFVRTLEDGARARPLMDVEPILERAWAARAGLGFVGKNGLVISPGTGSFILLGEVVTTVEIEPDEPITERCGSCTRCLDACPTGAFAAPFVLDPRRCIAYLTIEAREPPPEELASKLGDHLFGCDDCQTACPFNRTAPGPSDRVRAFAPHPRFAEMTIADVATMDDAGFDALTEGSPLGRTTRLRMAEQAVRVLAHRQRTGSEAARISALSELQRCLGAEDPSVRELARQSLKEVALR